MNLLLAGTLLLGAFAPSYKAGPPLRTDLYGDPLPPGAIARLGTVRLRHVGLSHFVCLGDNKTVITVGSNHVLRYWDLASGRQLRGRRVAGADKARWVKLSPDGQTLTGLCEQILVFWDVESGKEVQRLPWGGWALQYLLFSPDGKTLAAGREDYKVILWDWRAGTSREFALSSVPRADKHWIDIATHATFSPDGRFLVAQANHAEPLCVFDLVRGREVHRLRTDSFASAVSPDSKALALSCTKHDLVNGRRTAIRLYDLKSGKQVKECPRGSEDPYFSLAFSPDGKTLACGFSDRSCLLDLATGRVLHPLTAGPRRLQFTPNGKTLVGISGGWNGLRVWDVATGKEVPQPHCEFYSGGPSAISPDGRLLAAAASYSREAGLWDVATGRFLRPLPLRGEYPYLPSLASSNDGRTIRAFNLDGSIQSWDVGTRVESPPARLKDPNHPPHVGQYRFVRVHPAPDGKTASALDWVETRMGNCTRLGSWDLATGRLLRQHFLRGELRDATWHPDGRAVVVAQHDVLSVIDVEDGGERYQLTDRAGPAFSPDGGLLAARLTARPGVGVCEASTGKEVATVETGRVEYVALHSDNRTLVTVDRECLRVWELATGKERLRRSLPMAAREGQGEPFVRSLRLTPDGRRAFTALDDGTGLVWDLSPARSHSDPAHPPDEKALQGWWAALAGDDARTAYAAAWRFGDAAEGAALAFLRRHLRHVEVVPPKVIRKYIEDLDSATFADRERARQALENLGHAAVPEMRPALERNPSLEVRRRLERLLTRAGRMPTTPEGRRELRAVQVLEAIGTTEASELLEGLAKGAQYAPLTLAARAALQRLGYPIPKHGGDP